MSPDLTSFAADAAGDNPTRLQALVDLAGGLDDAAPVVLLPVRLETRFVRVDVPQDGPTLTLHGLADLLATAGRAFARIAQSDLQAPQVGNHRQRRDAEHAIYALLERRVADAEAQLDRARGLQRDALDRGGDDAEAAVIAAAGELHAQLAAASRALRGLRSAHVREQFTARLDEVGALAGNVTATLERRTLPALALREQLDAPTAVEAASRRDAGLRTRLTGGAGVRDRPPPRVLRATPAEARSVAAAPVTVTHEQLAVGAAVYASVLAGLERGPQDAAELARLAGSASTIPLLPGSWKQRLLVAAEPLAGAEAERLKAALHAIRSDDPKLDGIVPRGDLTVVIAPATRVQDRLLVRVYPDDIAVDTHEEDLTAAERVAGVAFWTATVAAGGDEAAQRAAWRALCAGRGTRRAAWIARELQPRRVRPGAGAQLAERALAAMTELEAALRRVDETAQPGRLPELADAATALQKALGRSRKVPQPAIDQLRERFQVVESAAGRLIGRRPPSTLDPMAADALATLRTALGRIAQRLEAMEPESDLELVFPAAGSAPKDGAWTRAAGSGVLPERFLVLAVSGDRVTHAVASGPVDPALKLSIDPGPSGDAFTPGADGELTVAPSIRWMVDFDEAQARGMALTIDLTPREAEQGFDRLYAIGLRGDGAAGGAQRLEELLDNHHFGESGLGLVTPGTPTNNTEAQTAGFDSRDDPDAAFARERGAAPFGPADQVDAAAPDGLRLARALGVDTGRLAHVVGAGGRSVAEALTMGRVLHPATVGGWLEEMAAPLVSVDARDRLRTFAVDHVGGGGLIPAFRVGAQPYGVLPAVAFTQLAQEAADTPGGGARQAAFDTTLKGMLDRMLEDWQAVRAEHVRVATDPPDGADAREHFLGVLGLESVTVTGTYRFAVNVAGRHGPPSLEDELQFGIPSASGDGAQTRARFGPYALFERFDPVLRRAFGISSTAPLRDPATGLVQADLEPIFTALQESRAYEVRWLRRTHPLRGPLVGRDPGPQLAALLAANPQALVAAAARGDASPSLLALLVRHAMLVVLRDQALRLLVDEQFLQPGDRAVIGSSGQFLTGAGAEAMTGWSYLLEPLAILDGKQRQFPAGHPLLQVGGALVDRLKVGAAAPVGAYAAAVAAHAADVQALAALPAERLATLLGEQLDVAGSRLDAWITGFAQRRLAAMRAVMPRGAHVGAYGWVEDLRPEAGAPLAPDVPAGLAGDPSRPIRRDPRSQGFVHAPSLNHAVTAAILRSGYLSQHRQADVDNRMAVNLSSRRTRLALSIIDGVSAGNRLGALLGYRLERFLHEYYATAGPGAPTLDALIGPLRAAYPSVAGVDAALSPDVAARQVCDGLAIVEAVQRWIAGHPGSAASSSTVAEVLSGQLGAHPWGLKAGAAPVPTDPRLEGFIEAVDHIADALDAVADLVIAETVHQFALGNPERAAAVLSALTEGKAPPRPELVDTPRTGTPVVHRVLLQLPAPAAMPAAWAAISATPRAAAEPALNAWLAGLLGAPADLRVRLVFANDGAEAGEVSVADLGLHAIDVLAILGPGLETGLGELAARALDARRPADFDDALPPEPLQVDRRRAPGWATDVASLFELAPLLEALGALVGRARAASAHDYVLAAPGVEGGTDGADAAELRTRVAAARSALVAAGVTLAQLLADNPALDDAVLDDPDPLVFLEAARSDTLPAWSEREQWRAALIDAAAFGIPAALPPAYFPDRVTVRAQLRSSAETAFAEIVGRLNRAGDLPAGSNTASCVAAATALFGEAFVVAPQVSRSNEAELQAALAAGLVGGAEIDGWLQGAGMVREAAGSLADVLVLAEARDASLPGAAVAQLPHDPAAQEPWLGGRVPPAVDRPGRLSLVVFGPASAGGAALLVDEWTEIVPSKTETTGIAVHYDQPDSSPPQCLLVAVPPRRRGAWNLGELVQTLHETFELTRVRGVEHEHLVATLYGQLLPAISGELVPDAVSTGATAGDRVILDFGAVR